MHYKRSHKFRHNTLLKRNPNQVFSEIDDEVILLSVDKGAYYNLNYVGSQIWHLLEKDTSYEALLENLMSKFDVTKEDCIKDLDPFLLESIKKGIILLCDE